MRFTLQYLIWCTRYVPSKLGCVWKFVRGNNLYLKIKFYHIPVTPTSFYVFSHVTLLVTPVTQLHSEKSLKMMCWHLSCVIQQKFSQNQGKYLKHENQNSEFNIFFALSFYNLTKFHVCSTSESQNKSKHNL